MCADIDDCQEFDERFQQVEKEHELFDLTIGDMRVWRRVRTGASIELMEKTGLTGEVNDTSTETKDRLRGATLPAKNVFSRNPFLADESEMLFFGHPRRRRIEDTWWDIYCDPIHEHTEFESVHLETGWEYTHRRPAQTTNLRYLDLITITSEILKTVGAVRYELSPAEKREVRRIEGRIRQLFDVEIDLETRFTEEISTYRVRKPLYDRLLDRVAPELVVIVAYSGHETFIEACHDDGIPVAELQHGRIGPYSYQHSFPGEKTKTAYPDYLLTFGEFWRDAAEYPVADDRILAVGYPYLEQEVNRYAHTDGSDDIVFISTPETGEEVSKIAVEAAGKSQIDRRIVYKLHPDEYDRWETQYPWLRESPVTVVDADGPSLYELFAQASIQVGVGSTALYEGLAFELETYLIDLPTVRWMSPVIEDGGATLVGSVDELTANITRSTSTDVRWEKYFRPNAIENVRDTLGELLAEGTVAANR